MALCTRLRHGAQLVPSRHSGDLYDVRDRPAIDLEMDSQIPSEVRHSFHNQATRQGTPLRNSADGNCAQKSKNQKNLTDEIVSWFHGTYYAYDWFFASAVAEAETEAYWREPMRPDRRTRERSVCIRTRETT